MNKTPLYNALRERNPRGIPHRDAVQIFLWIYCAVDVLPEQWHDLKIGREELEMTFRQLAEEGIVLQDSFLEDFSWRSLVESLLSEEIFLDQKFPERIGLYL